MTKKNKTQRTPSFLRQIKKRFSLLQQYTKYDFLINQFYIILNIVRLRTKDMPHLFSFKFKDITPNLKNSSPIIVEGPSEQEEDNDIFDIHYLVDEPQQSYSIEYDAIYTSRYVYSRTFKGLRMYMHLEEEIKKHLPFLDKLQTVNIQRITFSLPDLTETPDFVKVGHIFHYDVLMSLCYRQSYFLSFFIPTITPQKYALEGNFSMILDQLFSARIIDLFFFKLKVYRTSTYYSTTLKLLWALRSWNQLMI